MNTPRPRWLRRMLAMLALIERASHEVAEHSLTRALRNRGSVSGSRAQDCAQPPTTHETPLKGGV